MEDQTLKPFESEQKRDPVAGQITNPENEEEPTVKVALKIATVTAVVLLVLFSLYWGGKKLLLAPQDVIEEKESVSVVVRLECPADQVYTSLGEALQNPGNVCELDLSDSGLSLIPDEIYAFPELSILKASNNNLTDLTPYIGYLTKLTKLDLSNNQLSILPSQVGHLKQVRELDLSNNKFTWFVTQIGYMNQMTSLNLANNQIEFLEGYIGLLPNLEEMNLRGNKLTGIENQIGYLGKLTFLDLRDNNFTALPLRMDMLYSMRRLELGGNPLPAHEVERMKQLFPGATVSFAIGE
jgi:Leucine-rich repeat (LRR) protein